MSEEKLNENKKSENEDFFRLFEETIYKRDPFQDPKNIHDIDPNSYKADAIRSLLIQVDSAGKTNRLHPLCSQELQKQLLNDYRTIVDNQEGLNNYSKEVLANCSNRKNESSTWKTSLSGLSGKELISRYGPANKLMSSKPNPEFENLRFKDLPKRQCTFGSEYKKTVSTKTPAPLASTSKINKESRPSTSTQRNNFYNEKKHQDDFGFHENSNTSKPKYQSIYKSNVQSSKRKNDQEVQESNVNSFKTAKDIWIVDQQKKTGPNANNLDYGASKKTLGTRPSGLTRKFTPPIANTNDNSSKTIKYGQESNQSTNTTVFQKGDKIYDFDPEKVKNVDPKMLEVMINEILDDGPPVSWDDIAGLEFAKKTIQEIVVWPLLRPDIFKGLRGPPKGILLFGPPGTGKTLIGKCIASQSKSTFFSISASSLTSKWIGDGEKLVRALFVVARILQPSVVFIDEIDSLLSQRSDQEHESSRRLKTEFLVQLDGAATSSDDRILIVGATNRPQELDEAARRRLVKRLYIPLPETEARKTIIIRLLNQLPHSLTAPDLKIICENTAGYSGADMANLCKEAALGPIRELSFADIESIPSDELRPVSAHDFLSALSQVRASVSKDDLKTYFEWNSAFGSNYGKTN